MSDNGSALAVVEPITNSLEANVGVLMRRATDVAGVCREIVTKTAQTIQGRKYVRVEGWQAIAVAYGCVASARDVERVQGGVRAVGEVRRMSDGAVLSTAEGFVGEDEAVWFGGTDAKGKKYEPRPMYAVRAMAQTRAVSRACRGAFSFVVTLIDSSLSTTPAEEAEGVIVEGSVTPPPPVRGNTALRNALKPTPPPAPVPSNEPPPHTDADFRLEAEAPPPIAHIPAAPPTHDRNAHFAFGRDKGVIVADLSETSLKWYADCFNRDLADASKSKFHEKTRAQLATVVAELRYRGI